MPLRSGSGRRPSGPASTPESVRMQRVRRVQRGAAERARVEVALAGPDPDVEVADPARRDVERRLPALRHVRVEDHAGVGAALVLRRSSRRSSGRRSPPRRRRRCGRSPAARPRPRAARPPSAAGRAGPCRRRRRARRATRRGPSARTAGSPRGRAAPAAGRRSARRRGLSARRRRPVDARISPSASGRSCQSTSSHSPPAPRTKSQSHSPARADVGLRAPGRR